jgi:hypothetical protein
MEKGIHPEGRDSASSRTVPEKQKVEGQRHPIAISSSDIILTSPI